MWSYDDTKENRRVRKFLRGWWVWIIAMIMLATVVGGVLKGFGLIGHTILEREVFERSFQYSEGKKDMERMFSSQLALIEKKLMDSTLTETQRNNLESQRDAIWVQLGLSN